MEYNFWDDGSSSLANKVLLYRIENGMTMSELAVGIGISCHTIERIENKQNISIGMCKMVSDSIEKY